MTYCCCFDFEGGESNLRKLGEALGAGAGKEFNRLEQAVTFFFCFLFDRLLLFKCGARP